MTAPAPVRTDLPDKLLQIARSAVLAGAVTDRVEFHRGVWAVCSELQPSRRVWPFEWVNQVDALFASLVQCVEDRAAIDDDADGYLDSIGAPQLAECVANTRHELDRDITDYMQRLAELAR